MSFKSLSIKLLVLFFVLIIWAMQSLLKIHHKEIVLPVSLINLEETLIAADNSPREISFYVDGRGIDIYNLRKRNNYFEIDAKAFQKGDNEYTVTDQHIVLEDLQYRGLITFHLNRNVVFSFDRIAVKEIPVEKRYLTLEDEIYFNQRNASLSPNRVEIEGAQTLIQSISKITTAPLSEAAIASSDYIIELEMPEGVLGIRPDAVKVIMEAPVITTRTIPLIRIEFPADFNIRILPQYVTVKIEGVAARVQNIRPNMIRAYIQITPGYEYDFAPIRFEIPDDIELLEYTPQRVQIITAAD